MIGNEEKPQVMIISHRGNETGPYTASGGENTLEAVATMAWQGFGVEIDVLSIQEPYFMHETEKPMLWIGHDEITGSLSIDDLERFSDWIWFHCKYPKVFFGLQDYEPKFEMFVHDKDDFAITSRGNYWFYPNARPQDFDFVKRQRSVNVMPEWAFRDSKGIWDDKIYDVFKNFRFVCTDYPHEVKELYEKWDHMK